jgi:hypothetical protein
MLNDSAAPSSECIGLQYANGTVLVSRFASDETSGVFAVTLLGQYAAAGTWADADLSQQGEISGTFAYAPTRDDGTYTVATVAED